jgi:hypothetical protein
MPLECGLEGLDHKHHLIFTEARRLNLCHLIRESLLVVRRFEGDGLRFIVVGEASIGDVVNVSSFLGHHSPAHEFFKDLLGRHLCVTGIFTDHVYKIRIMNGK